ncbi:hypothetical protein QTP70_013350 [Hemibagrus guttatus]|uniref:ribonuclease H n=1 Tax=Hemibagrus guttatus TaxID=175788 RepID=A0AAE0R9V1_9TELE|nr:hypothetical protein QTP70_013350 [Hemibagrus guttatus]
MAELEELRKEFAEMQRRLAEQAGALDQARTEQREALSLVKVVMEQQASTPAPLVPEADQVELIKQHLMGEARDMVKFMSDKGNDSVEPIFKLLQEIYGDKVSIGTRLHQQGLKLKPSKCFFLRPEVQFLGHIISSKGVQVDRDKVQCLEAWPSPLNVREVRQLLGFMSYYRRFVPGFAQLAKPLHAQVGKGNKGKSAEPFIWSEECQTAFNKLKSYLMSPPILSYPDRREPQWTWSHTQPKAGDCRALQSIAYASHGLKGSKRNDRYYSAFKLELLALKWAITEKFKEYLIFAKFQLSEFNFEVCYKPGRQNTNADVLSMIPCGIEQEKEDTEKDFIRLTSDEVRAYLWTRSYARILFVDFSSAFNMIIPALLRDKLFQLNVPDSMCSWIIDFLTDRRQFVRLGTHVSDLQHISTGSPQGCVLSPLLFSLYTNGCTSDHQSVKLLKFADDTTLIGLISDGDELFYRGEMDRLVSWCSMINLELNSLKTVEMIVDFRKDPAPLPRHPL